ncbi:MAG: hydroxymethylbilane synthase, partial [Haloferacaceae archaeon]
MATRSSDLAIRQAASVREAVGGRRVAVELVEVETRGDQVRDELIHRLGRTGAFVHALDERVLDGDLDAAVHSMKDMPTERPDRLVVAAVPERAPAGDVLVTPDGRDLESLPEGAVVGTSSLRRRALLGRERDDLDVRPLRGNVDTRVEKLLAPSLQREYQQRLGAAGELEDEDDQGEGETVTDPEAFDRTPAEWFEDCQEIERRALEREVETEYDAIVLAEAGLDRLGLLDDVDAEHLPTGSFVPAPGQGAIAVTAADESVVELLHDRVDDPETRVETTVERTVLAELGGGCVAPIGVHATLRGEHVHVDAVVADPTGSDVVEGGRDLPVERHAAAAREFAAHLADRGAADLIADARDEADAGREDEADAGREDEADAGREDE